jgi:hypothetical protein
MTTDRVRLIVAAILLAGGLAFWTVAGALVYRAFWPG